MREHVRRYMRAAFTLAADPAVADRRLGALRAPARLSRPLLDQEQALLDHVQGSCARRARPVHEQILARSSDPIAARAR